MESIRFDVVLPVSNFSFVGVVWIDYGVLYVYWRMKLNDNDRVINPNPGPRLFKIPDKPTIRIKRLSFSGSGTKGFNKNIKLIGASAIQIVQAKLMIPRGLNYLMLVFAIDKKPYW